MMDARKLRAELDLPATDAAERLSAIALGLSTGEVGLAAAGRSHLLRPGPDVRMELDASQGEHDGRLTIGLVWYVPQAECRPSRRERRDPAPPPAD